LNETLRFAGATLAGIPVWLAYTLVMVVLVLLGVPIVGLGILFKAYTVEGERTDWKSRAMWLWGNDEDGIDGYIMENGLLPSRNRAWLRSTLGWPHWKMIFVWSAWRNSVGNARRVPFFGIAVNPDQTHIYIPGFERKLAAIAGEKAAHDWWEDYRGTGPYVARNKWAYELRFPWPGRKRFAWIGWRIAQQDAPNTQVGFACQLWGKV